MQDSHPTTTSRRRVLRSAGAALTAAAAGSAGCLSSLPPLGSQIEFGRVDVPDAPYDPRYRRWVPDPGAFPDDHFNGDPTLVVPRAFRDDEVASLSSIGRSILRSKIDYFGVGYDEYSLAVGLGRSIVVEGEFDRSTVESTVNGTGYAPAGDYRGYALYDRPDGNRIVAVRDGALVFQSGGPGRDAVEHLVDVAAGDRDRYDEVNEDFDAFSRHIRLSPSILFGFGIVDSGDSPGAVTASLSFRFDDEGIYFVFDHFYADEDAAVSRSQIRDQLRTMNLTRDRMLVEIEADGRRRTVKTRMDRPIPDPGAVRDVPQVTWGWEIDRDAHTITLRHEAGDSFEARYAEIVYGNDETDTTVQFDDEYDTVGPGAELTIELPAANFADGLMVQMDLGENSTAMILNVDPEASP